MPLRLGAAGHWGDCVLSGASLIPGTDQAALLPAVAEVLSHYVRGQATLHGSCVRLNGHSLSFVGPSGMGKSTITAYLFQRGATLVSDGVTIVDPLTRALTWRHRGWRLRDDVLRQLGYDPDVVPHADSLCDKRLLTLAREPEPEPAMLDCVYIIEDANDGESTHLRTLGGAEQVMALIRNYYLVERFSQEESARLLERSAQLIRGGLKVVGLVRPRRWEALGEIAALLAQSWGAAEGGAELHDSASP